MSDGPTGEQIQSLARQIAEALVGDGTSPIVTVPEGSSSVVQFSVPLRSILTKPAVRKAVMRATEPRAPTTIVAHTWRADFRYTGPGGITATNVFWGQSPSFDGSAALCQVVANAYLTAWQYHGSGGVEESGLRDCLSQTWTLEEIVVSDNGGTTDNFFSLPVGMLGNYPAGLGPAAPQVAAVASWDIDKKYKGGHPRTYFPGIDQEAFAAQGGNTWSSTFVTLLKWAALNFLKQLIAQLIANAVASPAPGIISRFDNGPRPSAIFVPITNSDANPVTVNSRIDTQRRRVGKEITAR